MAATITIRLVDVSGDALSTQVLFTSLSTPTVASTSIVIGKNESTNTDSTGIGSIALQAGDYLVRILDERFKISVPANSGSYELANIATSDLTWTLGTYWRNYNGTLQILNDSDSLWYSLRSKNIDGVAVLYLSDTGIA